MRSTYFNSKKGISALVATVLLILITIAAVGVIWLGVMPMINENVKSGQVCLDAIKSLQVDSLSGYTFFNTLSNETNVMISRGADTLNLAALRILVSGGGTTETFEVRPGTSKTNVRMPTDIQYTGTFANDDIPPASEARSYIMKTAMANPEKVAVLAIVKVGAAEKACEKSEAITLITGVSENIPYVPIPLPIINIILPANNMIASGTNNITFVYNVSDASNIANCSLILNGAINQINTSITKDINQEFNATLEKGIYDWSVNCTDTAGNENNSESRELTVSYNPPILITSCTNLGQANTIYYLNQNISGNQPNNHCIDIQNNSITLDCQGYWINGSGITTTFGIYMTGRTNVTIKNCKVKDYGYGIGLYSFSNNNTLTNNNIANNTNFGIYLTSSSNNTIINNNIINNNSMGIRLTSSSNNTIINNNIINNNGTGIYFMLNSRYNTITNNTINSNAQYGIYFTSSSNNTITNNIANNNTKYGIYLQASSNSTIYNNFFNNTNNIGLSGTTSNSWNTTKILGTNIIGGNYLGGNFWANSSAPGTGFSENPSLCGSVIDGICQNPYTLIAGNVDSLPLTLLTPGAQTCGQGISAGMISYWKAEGNALDSVDGNNGVTAAFTSGQVGQAFRFDGSNYINITTDAEGLRVPKTISFWTGTACNASYSYNVYMGREVYYNYTGWVVGCFSNTDGSGIKYVSFGNQQLLNDQPNGNAVNIQTELATDTWHHIVFTYDGTTAKAYLDGVLKQTKDNIIINPVINPHNYLIYMFIGSGHNLVWGDTPINFAKVNLDEIAVWNRALSLDEINQLYIKGQNNQPYCTPT